MNDETRPDLPTVLSAAAIRSYMRNSGWRESTQGTVGSVWAKGDAKFCVPHEGDDPDLLQRALVRLASAEGRTPEETAAAILAHRAGGAVTAPATRPSLWRRKTKPLEVMHWDGSVSGATAVIDWILANDGTARYHDDPARLRVDLPRGTVDALPGDRIIKAEDGTFRPLDEPGFFSLLEPVGVMVSGNVTSPAPAPAKPPAASTGPSASVSEAAVQDALDAVPKFWKEAHAVLQAYPSARLARVMLEAAAPRMAAERAGQAEARLAEVRQTIASFFTHHGNSAAFALQTARDLAEGIRQVLDRAPLEALEGGKETRP